MHVIIMMAMAKTPGFCAKPANPPYMCNTCAIAKASACKGELVFCEHSRTLLPLSVFLCMHACCVPSSSIVLS